MPAIGGAQALARVDGVWYTRGVGVRPPIPSWGNMISDGLRIWQLYPHVLAAPAAVLAIVTIAFSFLGDGLNDALNPRQWK